MQTKATPKMITPQLSNKEVIEDFSLGFQKAAQEAQVEEPSEQLRIYLSCIMLLLMKLELTRRHSQRPDILLPAKLNYKE
jgi:hypothetical protein